LSKLCAVTELTFSDPEITIVDTAKKRRKDLLSAWVRGSVLLLPLLLASPSKAYGYVDPGSGSYVYQAIYAACIGGVFYFRKFLVRIFGKRNK
jgi:hypothetical protein